MNTSEAPEGYAGAPSLQWLNQDIGAASVVDYRKILGLMYTVDLPYNPKTEGLKTSVEIMDNCKTPESARTFLRERFLRMLGSLSGSQALVHMQEKTTVHCKLGVADVDFQHVHVSHMATPMGVLPHATLRVSDIISIEVPQVPTPGKES